MTTISEKVYKILRKIPKGKVLTYKKLAILSGIKSPRVVGNILHRNPDQSLNPCHRVVSSDGKLAEHFVFGGIKGQTKKLEDEGVIVKNGKVDLLKFLWRD